MRSNQQLKQIAVDLHEEKIYVLNNDPKDFQYEYMEKASSRGYFTSVKFLSPEEFKIMNGFFIEYIKLKQAFLSE
jgi:hypothetical protein